jgi:phospholipase/lecithinase/hemolysin
MNRRFAASAARLAIAAGSSLLAVSAQAQSFSQMVVFGDSTVDAGFYKALPSPGSTFAPYNAFWAAAVAAGAGAPTTAPGLMNVQILAARFGLSANPANQPGGTNFATSGAKDVIVNSAANGGFLAAIPVAASGTGQIDTYLAMNGGRANSNGLFLISSGGNDVSFAFGGFAGSPITQADKITYLQNNANGLATRSRSCRTQVRGPLSFLAWIIPSR